MARDRRLPPGQAYQKWSSVLMTGRGIERRSICNMDISALRALVALREHASFARVSERVNLSSSAVFCQIRQLEDQLGQKLYERHGKALHLTATGNSLATYAEEIVHMHNFALSTLRSEERRVGKECR